MFTSTCPFKVQISRGLGPFFQIELLKTGPSMRIGRVLFFGAGTVAEPGLMSSVLSLISRHSLLLKRRVSEVAAAHIGTRARARVRTA